MDGPVSYITQLSVPINLCWFPHTAHLQQVTYPTSTYVLSQVAVLYSLGVMEKASTHLVPHVGFPKYFLPVSGWFCRDMEWPIQLFQHHHHQWKIHYSFFLWNLKESMYILCCLHLERSMSGEACQGRSMTSDTRWDAFIAPSTSGWPRSPYETQTMSPLHKGSCH